MPKIFLSQLENELKQNPSAMIDYAERHYEAEIDTLANTICSQSHLKVVLLAGPSGSGKTTSANMLCDRIKRLGHRCSVVSLDDFFKNTNEYPLNPDGTPDFESIYSLEVELIKSTLLEIIEKGSAMIPYFDFEHQRRHDNAKRLELGNGGILIIEGIHALNPIIGDSLPQENICREKFDIVFADPPYALQGLDSIPDKVLSSGILHPGCYFILEHGGEYNFSSHTLFKKEKTYGRVHFSIFETPSQD